MYTTNTIESLISTYKKINKNRNGYLEGRIKIYVYINSGLCMKVESKIA
ncbi:MAG: hypothetical protein ACLU8F_07070 [Clostridia bacterium]